MEEQKSLMNKTAAELTVQDQLVLMVAAPIVVFGGLAIAGGIASVCSFVAKKVRRNRKDRTVIDTTAE